jgi:hypothetical protein
MNDSFAPFRRGTPLEQIDPLLERGVPALLEWAVEERLWPWSEADSRTWMCEVCGGSGAVQEFVVQTFPTNCASCASTGLSRRAPPLATVLSLLAAGPEVLGRVRAILEEFELRTKSCVPMRPHRLCRDEFREPIKPVLDSTFRTFEALREEGLTLLPLWGKSFFWFVAVPEIPFRMNVLHDTIQVTFDVKVEEDSCALDTHS